MDFFFGFVSLACVLQMQIIQVRGEEAEKEKGVKIWTLETVGVDTDLDMHGCMPFYTMNQYTTKVFHWCWDGLIFSHTHSHTDFVFIWNVPLPHIGTSVFNLRGGGEKEIEKKIKEWKGQQSETKKKAEHKYGERVIKPTVQGNCGVKSSCKINVDLLASKCFIWLWPTGLKSPPLPLSFPCSFSFHQSTCPCCQALPPSPT